MSSVFRKQYTKPMPEGAELFTKKGQRFARWRDGKGRTRTAPLAKADGGKLRVVLESPLFHAKYRDGAGVLRVVPTGCRDEKNARQYLADLETKAEKVRSGVLTAAEVEVGRHRGTALAEHFKAYLAHLETKGACPEHRAERDRQLKRLAEECGFKQLADLDRGKLERWLNAQAQAGMGARTRNSYVCSLVAFCNWCVEPAVGRLVRNPFDGVPRADEKADPRRQRRAMSEDELVKLLAVARERPLLEALTVRKGPRKGQRYAEVRPEVRARLARLGEERALIYKTLVLTGLRKGELASLTVSSLRLDAPLPVVVLAAADEKNREGNEIPLRDDLADDLRAWLAGRLQALQEKARTNGDLVPDRLPPDAPLFDVPVKLCKILARDLKMAGVPKKDDRGRTLDVHALRHTFGTLMSKGGVAPRTAQAAMRHKKIDLTMSVYTDPRLLDVRGALNALPSLALAPTLAPTPDKSVQAGSSPGKPTGGGGGRAAGVAIDANACPVKTKGPLSPPDNGPGGVGATGLEPVTPSVSSWCSSQLS